MSRPMTGSAKQSIGRQYKKLVCPRSLHGSRFADVGCNDGRIRFRILAASFARGLACSFRPLQSEGAGNAGRPMRPIAACAEIVEVRTRVVRSHRKSPGIPRAMVLTVSYRALPGDRAFLPPVICGIACRKLDASVGASGPHDFAVRVQPRPSSAPPASTASRPDVRDVAQRPSEWGGTAGI